MTVPTYLNALEALQSPAEVATQIAALKHIKTEIVGHVEKKESLVKKGILEVLVKILESSAKSRGKKRHGMSEGLPDGSGSALHWAEEDEATLQAVLLLGSFAHAGPSFVAPILASSALSPLLSTLSPQRNPARIVLAALRALNSLADVARRTLPVSDNLCKSFIKALYTPEAIQGYAAILAQRSPSSTVHNQVGLLSRLIRRTCTEESHQTILLCGGVLDLLAVRIAAFYAVHESWSRWSESKHGSSLVADIPPPSKQCMPEVFRAADAIVRRSIYRMMRLVHSPTAKRVFSLCPPESPQFHKAIADAAEHYCLPRVPQYQLASRKGDHGNSKHFPALGSSQARGAGEALAAPAIESPEETERVEGYLSSLVTWLLVTIKDDTGPCRVAAAKLFTTLTTSGLFGQYLDRMAAMVVIPRLIDFAFEPVSFGVKQSDGVGLSSSKAAALDVVARLVEDRAPFQKAALDAGVIEKTCTMLKLSFEPIEVPPAAWSPQPVQDQGASKVASCTLGLAGIPESLECMFHVRQKLLNLVATMAREDDDYRKKFNEGGATQCIIDSLKPLDESSVRSTNNYEAPPKKTRLLPSEFGNPVRVLLAACGAARSLSRSVSLLRTSLIDSGLAAPIFALLKHPNVEVMKAATDVVCNLNPEFSPMRQDLVEAGAIKTLCQHARSADPEICIRSLWALKHLVHQLHNDIKQQCFEELGSGWLMQVIAGNQFGSQKQDFRKKIETFSLGGANAAGEKVDILNASDERMSDGFDMTDRPAAYDSPITLDNDDQGATALALLTQNDPPLAQIPNGSRELLYHMRVTEASRAELSITETELNIQRQGLDFLRNFIISPGAPELIDTVFRSVGVEELFNLVTEKIRVHSPPEVLEAHRTMPSMDLPHWGMGPNTSAFQSPSPRMDTTTTTSTTTLSARKTPIPLLPNATSSISTQLLHSAIMTLTHIAAGDPRQRSLLLSQTPLVMLLHAHLSHPQPTIRCAVAWCINNLTWMDDSSDVTGVIGRCQELRRLGFVERLRAMMDDPNVDVRERVGTALTQTETALKAGENGTGGGAGGGLGSGSGIRGPGVEREGGRRAREGRLS